MDKWLPELKSAVLGAQKCLEDCKYVRGLVSDLLKLYYVNSLPIYVHTLYVPVCMYVFAELSTVKFFFPSMGFVNFILRLLFIVISLDHIFHTKCALKTWTLKHKFHYPESGF